MKNEEIWITYQSIPPGLRGCRAQGRSKNSSHERRLWPGPGTGLGGVAELQTYFKDKVGKFCWQDQIWGVGGGEESIYCDFKAAALDNCNNRVVISWPLIWKEKQVVMVFWTISNIWFGCFNQRLRKCTQGTVEGVSRKRPELQARPEKQGEVEPCGSGSEKGRREMGEASVRAVRRPQHRHPISSGQQVMVEKSWDRCGVPERQAGQDSRGKQRQDPREKALTQQTSASAGRMIG